jgi:hypothetical protein
MRSKKFLALLEELYERVRKPVIPLYPYNQATGLIKLPVKIDKELRDLVTAGKKPEAVKRVSQLTGAGLRLSKDYVDSLVKAGVTKR